MMSNYDGSNIEFKNNLPLLPVRDLVIYPYMILPLFVGRESSMLAVEHALNHTERMILLASQKDVKAENPATNEIYEIGTVAMIMRMRKLPDGRLKILVQGIAKVRITQFEQLAPFFKVAMTPVNDLQDEGDKSHHMALMRNVREQLEKVISLGKNLSPDILMVLEDIHTPGRMADLIASNLGLQVGEAQMVLETLDPVERLKKVLVMINRELDIVAMQNKIRSNTREEINKTQKEFFLREQIKAIKQELGDGQVESDDEFEEMRKKVLAAKMPEHAEKEVLKQLGRLEKMHPDSSESSILRNYLEWMIDLPWSVTSDESIDLAFAQSVLDEDHFDLKVIKERILEFLAVRQLKGNQTKGPILCFSGPPGVGKTSLGKSIARATGRKFVRISLGGVKDEAEIRGHRRTYVGSMPGRFIQALKQVGTNNPVILLDEIDKLGGDYKGDPSSALLEVLDPEQNKHFRDHYLNVHFDLSNVMFIATANMLEQIPGPLRDRMEVISLSGYTQEEKLAISKKYLIPKQMDENGVTADHIEFSDEGVKTVIQNFTSEAGLRNLERKIGALCRKVAMKIAKGEVSKTHIVTEMVEKLLGPPTFTKEDQLQEDYIGVVTGLAWTSAGGEVLYVESTLMNGKGLTLTGKLGETMRESAQAALGHIRSKAKDYCVDEDLLNQKEIHVHLPAGAIPKDGPSAGITLATAIVSLLTQTPVDHTVAMTGEITLTGRVLPIGGLKEKALAAMRMGIKTIIIPWKNQKDLVEIPEEYREKLTFVPVKTLNEVLEIALMDWSEKKKNYQERLSALEELDTQSEEKITKRNSLPPVAA
jgi:ATP-dependent Lon protease